MIRIKKIILYLCMVALLVSNISICAFASDLNDGVNDGFDRYMGGTNIKGFNSWEITDKKSLFANNIATFFADIGMYFRGQSNQSLLNIFTEHLIETNRIENADSLDSYIASHMTANEEETELYMSSDMVNSLHETAVTYIEEETGYFVIPTLSAKDLLADNFYNKDTFDMFKNYINNLGTDICIVNGGKNGSTYSGEYLYQILNGTETRSNIKAYFFYKFSSNYGLVSNQIINSNGLSYLSKLKIYDEEWNNGEYGNLDFLTIQSNPPFMNECYQETAQDGQYYMPTVRLSSSLTSVYFTSHNYLSRLFTSDGRSIRVYKTLDDFKNYSAGTRPYYITDAFKNYDSTIDNSTTITQTEIDNSVTYGDVYNYITNNYENPDGLSEDELRAILAEYLSSINNSGGSGSGSGSGDSGGSGGGLGGFLDGLGSIGNAILAILGKLMEILGSAIELVTGAITDLITIIPNSIGELLGALFPVFPEEWIKAITLSLVLGVIVGIMRMFK